MTPKEKAKELVDKFFLLHESATDEKGNWTICIINKGLSKKCALISVYEIINFENSIISQLSKITNDAKGKFITKKKYWEEVKKEIELM